MIEKWEEIVIIKLIEHDNGFDWNGGFAWKSFVRSRHTIKNLVEKAPFDEMDAVEA